MNNRDNQRLLNWQNRRSHFTKKGQITIFIIVAVVIVLLALLIYFFYPQIITNLGFGNENPSQFMQTCIEGKIQDGVKIMSAQGGSINPEHFFMYQGDKIEYLCYQEQDYLTCVMQQPMLQNHIEAELKNYISDDVNSCMDSMKKTFASRGYEVNFNKGDFEVELLPKQIAIVFNNTLKLTNQGGQVYEPMSVFVNNNLYELIGITNSILNWEARYGNSETTTYMNYYHDLKIEKKKQTDGTTIYILTDRNNGNKFQFATRSLVWPSGYGTDSMLIQK